MSELVDLVDSDGIVKIRAVPREKSTESRGLYMQIVVLVIFNENNEVLWHRRHKKKSYPDLLDLVCGGVLSGENPEDAAIRESKEEVGIKPDRISLVECGINEYDRFRWLFVAKTDENPSFDETAGEVSEVGFSKPEHLKNLSDDRKEKFVDGFFEDLEKSMQYLKMSQ